MHEDSFRLGNGAHILLIDDQPEELRSLRALLQAEGFRVSLASDPRQGLQRALALYPDLILLDVRMPQVDGFALCRLLREAPGGRQAPIIFLTSAASIDERLTGLQLGSVDYVLKSCVPEEILARIRIHLQLVWREQLQAPLPPPQPVDPDEMILHAAMRLIARHLDRPPPLTELARQVGTYDKRLSGVFRRRLGMTVFAWIREERLRKSQELLRDSSMSIQDIAELVGFSSAGNFATAFRERLGMTPSEFRERVWESRTDC
ncbi:Response regulator [Azotobacter vinelandii CA]|uniref:Response regulator n=2 Tax=Azotobacter vinelandii TaxID=354 RepID=C1DES0_AZOVD|nr:DNA-binding response regulator [Azotobacter vinelandii]ACO80249.1 Response regulator [Azotobacter vinelandii DJ]AGK16056.1 Response regulator [Azotobacter vinelandii CA]AGK21797.1 Response regulator [Azotobacter vinelandii CA6]WKN21041.1 DNA-binding response regulator [Azotobacter vinelandii]SFX72360.1 two component transcriptional regulator, AraC family [Azotobacter vinelandii]